MAMDQSDVKALRSDALGPAEIEAKAETLAVGKAGMAGAKCFVLAMLAGAFIAFGATYFLVFLGDSAVPFAAQRMVGGICFSLGLVLVLCCGAELFTGNMLMVTGLASKKIKLGGLVRNWVIVWLGNLVFFHQGGAGQRRHAEVQRRRGAGGQRLHRERAGGRILQRVPGVVLRDLPQDGVLPRLGRVTVQALPHHAHRPQQHQQKQQPCRHK